MSAIAYYLEDQGIATTGISLVRENTVSFAPPRFLWVSFPLERPLGAPGDVALKDRVIDHALSLLDRDRGPVLEDFPEDVPAATETLLACPVSFPDPRAAERSGWAAALADEIAELAPWYAASVERRGQSRVGILCDPPATLGARLASLLDDGDECAEETPPDLRHLLEDLKTYYLEAVAAQPGASAAQHLARVDWMWLETSLGQGILTLRARMLASGRARTRELAQVLVPRRVVDACEGGG